MSGKPESTGKRRQQHPEDLTLCPLCDELLTDPRLLPCIHTLCLKCLEKDEGGEPGVNITCPICEAECPVPETGLAGLQTNAFIHQLLRIREITCEEPNFACGACKMPGEKSEVKDVPATQYCVECEEKLCINCSNFHGVSKILRGHRMLDLDTLRAHEAETIFSAMSTPCNIHQDQRMTFFCKDCRLVVCPHCNMMSHKTHETSELASVVEEVRHSLDHDSARLTNQTEELCELMDSVELQKVEFLKKVLVEKAKIAKKAAKLIRLVEVSKQTLLDELQSRETDILKQFESVSHELTRRTISLGSLKYYCGELSRKAAASVLISQSSSIHSRVVELLRVEDIEEARSSLGVVDVRFKESGLMQICGNVCGEVEVKVITRVQPEILKRPDNIDVAELGHARFKTTVTGEPEPSVEWFKGEVKLMQCPDVSIEEDGNVHTLVLKRATCTDNGLYTVKATNRLGTATASATLKVTARAPITTPFQSASQVTGVTSLSNQLFAVRFDAQQQIEVYDGDKLTLQQIIAVPGLVNTYGLASCAYYACLYVSSFTANYIHKVMLSGELSGWSTDTQPTGISVSQANNVLVTCYGQHTVAEYNTNGGAIRIIDLQAIGIVNPWHCISLQSGNLAVSNNDSIHVVSLNGQIIHKYGGSIELDTPVKLALTIGGNILVANHGDSKLLVLDWSLRTSYEIALPTGVTLNNPRAVHLDSSRDRLYVGQGSVNCVVMLGHNYMVYQSGLLNTIPGSGQLLGVASLDDQLFVRHQSAQTPITVYDATSFTFMRNIPVPGLENTLGNMVACPVNKCLYVSNSNMNMVHKIDLRDSVTRWNVFNGPTGISVNQANNVIIICPGIVAEYTTQGSLVRKITINPDLRITNDSQIIQLTNDQWAVSNVYSEQSRVWIQASTMAVTVVNATGALVSRYPGSVPLDGAVGLVAVDSDHFVVASQNTNKLVVATSNLKFACELSLPADILLQGSRVLSIDKSRDRLYVGENNGRVLAFEKVSTIGNDYQLCCL